MGLLETANYFTVILILMRNCCDGRQRLYPNNELSLGVKQTHTERRTGLYAFLCGLF